MQQWHWAMLLIIPLMWRRDQWRTWAALMGASSMSFVAGGATWANLAIDIVAGSLVLARPAGVEQRAIGLIFSAMAIMDLGYSLSAQLDGGLRYWWWQSALGWVQWCILAAWGAHGLGTALWSHIRHHRDTLAHPAGHR